MKKIATLIAVLLICSFLLTACSLGKFTESGGAKPDEYEPEYDDGHTESLAYTVSVYYKNQPFDPMDNEVDVIWQKDNESVVARLNRNGKASAGILDGDYSVYLSGLPEQYSYNPNAYSVSNRVVDGQNKRHADIIINDIQKPVSGDGGINAVPKKFAIYEDGGCFRVAYQGTYRVTCKKNQIFYFQFTPEESGEFVVQSLVSVFDDDVNPFMDIYSGNASSKQFAERRDGGGATANGGYTKNFAYTIKLGDEGVGNSFTFGVSAETKSGIYPVTVDFEIKWLKPYASGAGVIEPVEAQEADRLTPPEAKGKYVSADVKGVFNDKITRCDPTEGVYRLYDEEKYPETNGYGPYLCCSIKSPIPCYSTTTLFDANEVGETAQNLLELSIWDNSKEAYVSYDYTSFIRDAYASKCNEDGRCYVTDELKEFLQYYALKNELWTDKAGITDGTPEQKGYKALHDSMWLFACGYYEEE